ncbi:adenylate kinase [Desulfobotulus mexicanus]|uniref:Adenylate kinase n=1 Tax=Desulfobotulus mexicanus TaxID=2586642 RepID=A0A5Q4VFR2_9BACT|nr:adenylate kinase [Desulfobotulus mexicanus]TYT75736.1 adenylate kinase [Desulfobotulus mexicanus]
MNILFFGPNGSGKGTQGAILKEKYKVPHIESGAIFRENIKGGTELGMKAKSFIDAGDLVPDDITIPMILDRLQREDCKGGWLLDGFPRTPVQSQKLDESLKSAGIKLNFVVEINLDREIAKGRLIGRRLCENDPNHPNNVNIPAIAPKDGKCRVCGGALSTRTDDIDEGAIDKRHDIYYDDKEGTLASAYYFRDRAAQDGSKYIVLDGSKSVPEVTDALIAQL